MALDGTKGTWSVESIVKLPEGTQPQITPEEQLEGEGIVKNDPRVQALAKQVGEPASSIMIPFILTACNFRDVQASRRTRSSLTDGQLDTTTASQ